MTEITQQNSGDELDAARDPEKYNLNGKCGGCGEVWCQCPAPPAATDPPSSIGMNPMDHPWVATGDDRDADVVVYVVCVTEREPRVEFAHILFEADWGDREQADHIVKLHNDWLEARRAGESAERYRRAAS